MYGEANLVGLLLQRLVAQTLAFRFLLMSELREF